MGGCRLAAQAADQGGARSRAGAGAVSGSGSAVAAKITGLLAKYSEDSNHSASTLRCGCGLSRRGAYRKLLAPSEYCGQAIRT